MAGARASYLTADRWPWHWTYAIVLERRWEQIQELGAWDDDGNPPPKEFWHDHERIEQWVTDHKEARKRKYET